MGLQLLYSVGRFHYFQWAAEILSLFFTPISRRVKGLSEEEAKKIEGVELEFFPIFSCKIIS